MTMKTAKIFKNGQSQAVRLPKEFRFTGDHVFVKLTGNVVNLIPVRGFWNSIINSLPRFSDDFMDDRNQPASQDRENIL